MHHGPAGASVTKEQWMDEYRPALYRQIASARRVLMTPENPAPDQRHALLDLLTMLEEVMAATELVDETADARIRRDMLRQQARLMRP